MNMNEDAVPGPRRDFVGYGRHVPKVVWPDEARVAVNLVINYEEGSEVQMSADGRNESILGEMSLSLESQYRDLALESVYEYGARAGIWRLQLMPRTCCPSKSCCWPCSSSSTNRSCASDRRLTSFAASKRHLQIPPHDHALCLAVRCLSIKGWDDRLDDRRRWKDSPIAR